MAAPYHVPTSSSEQLPPDARRPSELQSLQALALSRPSARIHLASHTDRIEDPRLGAAWALHQLFFLGHKGQVCSWCCDLTWDLCMGCQLQMPPCMGFDRIYMGIGHCMTCFDAGRLFCRECSGERTIECGNMENILQLYECLHPYAAFAWKELLSPSQTANMTYSESRTCTALAADQIRAQ